MRWDSFVWGAVAGGLVGLGVWWVAQRKLDESFRVGGTRLAAQMTGGSARLQQQFAAGEAQLRTELVRQVQAQVPPMVNAAVMRTMTQYGISPAMAQQLAGAVRAARSRGLIA